MKIEAWIFGLTTLVMALVAPAYWFITDAGDSGADWTGTSALVMTALFYGFFVALSLRSVLRASAISLGLLRITGASPRTESVGPGGGVNVPLGAEDVTLALLREATDVLLEATPRDVDLEHVRRHILDAPGVVDCHDLHAWTITSGMPVLSAHVVVSSEALTAIGHEKMLHELQLCLGDHFDVEHCTFQLEPGGHAEHEPGLCH